LRTTPAMLPCAGAVLAGKAGAVDKINAAIALAANLG
jgi:hypothetical protein